MALARYRHFGKAADAIGLTQSALSQAIRKIEHLYGVALFERRNRQVTLTRYGEVVHGSARRILEDLDSAQREIRLLASLESGHLVVGADPYLSSNIAASALAGVMREHPALRFTSKTGYWSSVEPALLADQIDLYFGMPPDADHPDILYRYYDVPTPLVLCGSSHELARRELVSLAELLGYTIVTPLPPAWYINWAQQQVESLEDPEAVTRQILLEADSIGLVKRVACESNALTAALPEDVCHEVESGELCVLKLEQWPSTMLCCIATRKSRALPPAAGKLIEHVDAAIESAFEQARRLPSSSPGGERGRN